MEPGPCETCGEDIDLHSRSELRACIAKEEVNEAAEFAAMDHRAVLARRPALSYPAPWRIAEDKGGHVVVVCAEGRYTAEAPSHAAAEIIVAAVNAYAKELDR